MRKRPITKTFKVKYVVEIRLREVLIRNKCGSKGETILASYSGATTFQKAEEQYQKALAQL